MCYGQIVVWSNYYLKASLPANIQKITDIINFHFPILIWRVFTADVVNLYCKIYEVNKNGDRRLLNKCNFTTDKGGSLIDKYRFFHVAESCVMSSIFNSVKYNDAKLDEAKMKLRRYYKTLDPHLERSGAYLEFDVFHIVYDPPSLTERLVSRWKVNSFEAVRIYDNKNLSKKLISSYLRPFSRFGAYH